MVQRRAIMTHSFKKYAGILLVLLCLMVSTPALATSIQTDTQVHTYSPATDIFTVEDSNAVCPHSIWSDGACTDCGTPCTHSNWSEGICTTCSMPCTHSNWSEGI